jgi:hypothetical protein
MHTAQGTDTRWCDWLTHAAPEISGIHTRQKVTHTAWPTHVSLHKRFFQSGIEDFERVFDRGRIAAKYIPAK